MGDLFAWLISFFVLIVLLAILAYQLMCLTDLEFDYVNPYDSASRINILILPEFVTQGILCFLHLIAGHWVLFLMSLPYSYYNARLYMQRHHLVDVTEIYNQLPWEKQQRLFKLCYLIIVLIASIFWFSGWRYVTQTLGDQKYDFCKSGQNLIPTDNFPAFLYSIGSAIPAPLFDSCAPPRCISS